MNILIIISDIINLKTEQKAGFKLIFTISCYQTLESI